MMSQQIISAGMALLDANAPIARDVAVCIAGDRIIAVGSRTQIRASFPDAPERYEPQLIMIPALVNSHDHGRGLGTTPLGVPDDLLEVWLPGLWSQPTISPYLAALYDGLRLLRSGVCAVAHSHNPRNWRTMAEEAEATIRGYRDAGIRVAFHPPLIDQNALVYDDRDGFLGSLPAEVLPAAQRFMTPPALSRDEYLALCRQLLQRFHDPVAHTVHIQASPAGGQWCSDELIGAAVDFARTHGTRVQMHLLETRYQRAYAQRRWGTTFPRHLDAIGALGPWLTLAHMVWADPEDMALLAERGVGVAHNPSSNLRLRSGVAPLPELHAAGVVLGIGLDGHALDEDQDLLRELRLAWTLANRPGAAAARFSAREFLHIGTIGGAAITFGAGTPLGRIAPGFLADLVLIDHGHGLSDWTLGLSAPSPQFTIEERLPELLLRSVSRSNVRHVLVGGRWVVNDGRSAIQDEEQVAAALREELAQQTSPDREHAAVDAAALGPYLRRFYRGWDTY
jgi:cytosine/adenosine deaminase-related metal-dependent hydrolase